VEDGINRDDHPQVREEGGSKRIGSHENCRTCVHSHYGCRRNTRRTYVSIGLAFDGFSFLVSATLALMLPKTARRASVD
jgi:hypothetical protein